MDFRSGFVTLIGRPNVGKSTLLNALVGHKVSIVSPKPQTTRRKVVGFAQGPNYQVGFIDTPGLHEPHNRLQRAMVEQARATLADVDLIIVVVDVSQKPQEIEINLAKLLKPSTSNPQPSTPNRLAPILLCLNKMDRLPPELVVERVQAYCTLFDTQTYMFTCAAKNQNLDKLLDLVVEHLPIAEPLAPSDEFTNQSQRFMTAEIVREKILAETRQELPHATAVQIEEWAQNNQTLHIRAIILVERPSQRAIVLGKQGARIKKIGAEARAEIEALLGAHVYLDLHVAVRENWRSNPQTLRELEYTE